jgi:hypothetical protein
MRRLPAARIRLALFVLVLGALLGAECDPGDEARVVLIPDASELGQFSSMTVDVYVSSPAPIQAFDLALQWDPEMILAYSAAPHPEFDDDGALFTNPRFDFTAGTLDRVVDLRHGGVGAQGGFKIARIQFFSLGNAGPTTIQVTGNGLAQGDGNEYPVSLTPLTITIEP